MDAGRVIRTARLRAGLSLRELGARAATSHSTLAAYEQGRVVPTVDTFDRIVRAAGFASDVELARRIGGSRAERIARGDELIEVLELAAMFPARVEPTLTCPRFPSGSGAAAVGTAA